MEKKQISHLLTYRLLYHVAWAWMKHEQPCWRHYPSHQHNQRVSVSPNEYHWVFILCKFQNGRHNEYVGIRHCLHSCIMETCRQTLNESRFIALISNSPCVVVVCKVPVNTISAHDSLAILRCCSSDFVERGIPQSSNIIIAVVW